MGGVIVTVEADSKEEADKLLEAQKDQAEKYGLIDERTRYVGYDDKEKVWRGYMWLHS